MEAGRGPDSPSLNQANGQGPATTAEAPAGLRILAVDDQPALTEVVTRMLRPDGHVVHSASSGEQALEKLSQETYDVVLSDLAMGCGMSGWDLAAAVRERWPRMRFVLMSGWGSRLDLRDAQSRGADSVLSKPFSYAELIYQLTGVDPTGKAA